MNNNIDTPEQPDECFSCGYKAVDLKLCKVEHGSIREDAWLCVVCMGTVAGNAYFWPTHYDNPDIIKQISYCTNMILDAIRKSKESE